MISPLWTSKKLLFTTWYPKQPFFDGCFSWMIPNLIHKNGCFNIHEQKWLFRVPGMKHIKVPCNTTLKVGSKVKEISRLLTTDDDASFTGTNVSCWIENNLSGTGPHQFLHPWNLTWNLKITCLKRKLFNHHETKLVGGWRSPSEKYYIVKSGSFPQGSGWKLKNVWNHHLVYHVLKVGNWKMVCFSWQHDQLETVCLSCLSPKSLWDDI